MLTEVFEPSTVVEAAEDKVSVDVVPTSLASVNVVAMEDWGTAAVEEILNPTAVEELPKVEPTSEDEKSELLLGSGVVAF